MLVSRHHYSVFIDVVIKQKVQFKFNFQSIWDLNFSKVHIIVCIVLSFFKLNVLNGIAQKLNAFIALHLLHCIIGWNRKFSKNLNINARKLVEVLRYDA